MAARRPLVVGNWKMHKGVAETAAFLEALLQADVPGSVEVVVCPPFTSLPHAAMLLTGSAVGLGAQNVHWEDHGAFTGEVAAPMLLELGVRWAIVGHSERRALFGETDDTVVRRAARAQAAGLDVILCIGETLAEREAGATLAVLERQIRGIGALDPAHLVLAYEPVWAIGTGRNATTEQAQEAHAELRRRLAGTFGAGPAQRLRILYGGSLKPANARELLAQADVDGGLIGGASLDVDSFCAIMRDAAESAAGVDS
ncbi:MAG TPA: triose-phosphate isomerase [Thermoanaerobaculales bacterium]|nr:triose-phosphate isomerase [Thermoanaerobaculales bacterium]HQL28596.1 triose-phosphate isomerase [Thermoanaerobaculales bacterium]